MPGSFVGDAGRAPVIVREATGEVVAVDARGGAVVERGEVVGAPVRGAVDGEVVGVAVRGAVVGVVVRGAVVDAVVRGAAVGVVVRGAVGVVVRGAAVGAVVRGAAVGVIVRGTPGFDPEPARPSPGFDPPGWVRPGFEPLFVGPTRPTPDSDSKSGSACARENPGFDCVCGSTIPCPTGGVVVARRACGGGIVLPAAPIGRFASTTVCVVFGGGAVPPLRRTPGRYATRGCCVGRFERGGAAGCGAGGCDAGGCELALLRRTPGSEPRMVGGGGFVVCPRVCSTLHAFAAHKA